MAALAPILVREAPPPSWLLMCSRRRGAGVRTTTPLARNCGRAGPDALRVPSRRPLMLTTEPEVAPWGRDPLSSSQLDTEYIPPGRGSVTTACTRNEVSSKTSPSRPAGDACQCQCP